MCKGQLGISELFCKLENRFQQTYVEIQFLFQLKLILKAQLLNDACWCGNFTGCTLRAVSQSSRFPALESTGFGAIRGSTDKSPAEKEPTSCRLMPRVVGVHIRSRPGAWPSLGAWPEGECVLVHVVSSTQERVFPCLGTECEYYIFE